MSLKGHDFRSTEKIKKKPSTLKQKKTKMKLQRFYAVKRKLHPN